MDRGSILYFTYGAMMSAEVIRRRGIDVLAAERAHLPGYRLVFDIPGVPVVEPAFASIIESSEHQTHGMLYRLSPSDMERLHTFEGPEYRCIDVQAVGEQAGHVVARAYQTIEPVAGRRPSRRYLRVLCEAARSRQLPTDYIHELEQHPSSYIPVISEIGERCLGLGESVIRFMNQRKSQT